MYSDALIQMSRDPWLAEVTQTHSDTLKFIDPWIAGVCNPFCLYY